MLKEQNVYKGKCIMSLVYHPLVFTTSLLVSFLSVFVYVYIAVKFIYTIVYPGQYYGHSQCSLRAAG